MATFLDIGLLQFASPIFIFLLVFLIVYALLDKFKLISDDQGVNAIIAFAVACLTLLSKQVTAILFYVSPWFVVMFIFILFGMMAFRFSGVPETAITEYMSKMSLVHYLILVSIILIIFAAIGTLFGPSLIPQAGAGATTTAPAVTEAPTLGPGVTPADTIGIPADAQAAYQQEVQKVLFHPKILGLGAFALIITIAIRALIYKKPEKK
ncbi:MAG: hypothetical protein KAT43_00195 [Nanoarchaeota archaeon]|nr:hypothetical protein [Nanoarchaeota archaeon]